MLSLQTRAEFDSMLLERINTTFTSEVDLALASQAQFYFDALWAGALGLTETLGQYLILAFHVHACYVPLFHTLAVHNASDFTYDPEMDSAENFTDTLYANIRAVNFRGMSVRLKVCHHLFA